MHSGAVRAQMHSKHEGIDPVCEHAFESVLLCTLPPRVLCACVSAFSIYAFFSIYGVCRAGSEPLARAADRQASDVHRRSRSRTNILKSQSTHTPFPSPKQTSIFATPRHTFTWARCLPLTGASSPPPPGVKRCARSLFFQCALADVTTHLMGEVLSSCSLSCTCPGTPCMYP